MSVRIIMSAALLSVAGIAPARAADQAPAAPAAAVDPLDQMVCRKDKETGSLVKTKKTCHTRRQWAYIDETNSKFARDLADDTRTRPAGN
ncbi:MAG: hypothetical protein CFE37_13845 [Alphaproteobacteria bacterium PA4]|nr:MAG: hypothetical protein CFE37_13845 [Alphaproteobacteria bacterium PA4]